MKKRISYAIPEVTKGEKKATSEGTKKFTFARAQHCYNQNSQLHNRKRAECSLAGKNAVDIEEGCRKEGFGENSKERLCFSRKFSQVLPSLAYYLWFMHTMCLVPMNPE